MIKRVFLLTALVASLFLFKANVADAQLAQDIFTPVSGTSQSGTGSTYTQPASNSSGSYFQSQGQSQGTLNSNSASTLFTPSNSASYFSSQGSQSLVTGGPMQCRGAACINVSLICPLSLIYTREAKVGDTGIDVVALQKYLEAQRFLIIPEGSTYGYYGDKTAAALSLYQAASGIKVTGRLDLATRTSLNNRVFNDKYCFQYALHNALQFTIAAKANRTTIISNLNRVNVTAAGGRKFCLSSSASSGANACFSLAKATSFIGYLPNNVSVTRTALNFAKYTNLFSRVDYVPSDPQTAFGSVVYINGITTTTFSTTTSTTTTVWGRDTVETSNASSTQTIINGQRQNTPPVNYVTTTVVAPTASVSILNFTYGPSPITVKAGTVVTWTNKDVASHTVTSLTGSTLNSPVIGQGQSYTVTLTTPGTYVYYCSIHPSMRGTVIVTN